MKKSEISSMKSGSISTGQMFVPEYDLRKCVECESNFDGSTNLYDGPLLVCKMCQLSRFTFAGFKESWWKIKSYKRLSMSKDSEVKPGVLCQKTATLISKNEDLATMCAAFHSGSVFKVVTSTEVAAKLAKHREQIVDFGQDNWLFILAVIDSLQAVFWGQTNQGDTRNVLFSACAAFKFLENHFDFKKDGALNAVAELDRLATRMAASKEVPPKKADQSLIGYGKLDFEGCITVDFVCQASLTKVIVYIKEDRWNKAKAHPETQQSKPIKDAIVCQLEEIFFSVFGPTFKLIKKSGPKPQIVESVEELFTDKEIPQQLIVAKLIESKPEAANYEIVDLSEAVKKIVVKDSSDTSNAQNCPFSKTENLLFCIDPSDSSKRLTDALDDHLKLLVRESQGYSHVVQFTGETAATKAADVINTVANVLVHSGLDADVAKKKASPAVQDPKVVQNKISGTVKAEELWFTQKHKLIDNARAYRHLPLHSVVSPLTCQQQIAGLIFDLGKPGTKTKVDVNELEGDINAEFANKDDKGEKTNSFRAQVLLVAAGNRREVLVRHREAQKEKEAAKVIFRSVLSQAAGVEAGNLQTLAGILTVVFEKSAINND